eukprot:COSAG03_NODE_2842_length_2412_cov_2530.501513_2_plen_98_part_00
MEEAEEEEEEEEREEEREEEEEEEREEEREEEEENMRRRGTRTRVRKTYNIMVSNVGDVQQYGLQRWRPYNDHTIVRSPTLETILSYCLQRWTTTMA